MTDTTDIKTDLRSYRSAGVKGAKLTICDRAADHIEEMEKTAADAAIMIRSLMRNLSVSGHIVLLEDRNLSAQTVLAKLETGE